MSIFFSWTQNDGEHLLIASRAAEAEDPHLQLKQSVIAPTITAAAASCTDTKTEQSEARWREKKESNVTRR